MMSILLFVMMFFDVPGAENQQLGILIEQSQSQIEELRHLLKSTNVTRDELERASDLLEKMTQGIDAEISPLEAARPGLAGVVEQQSSKSNRQLQPFDRSDWKTYRRYFPKKAETEAEDLKEFLRFQQQITEANTGDFGDLMRLQSNLLTAEGGELSRMSVQVQSKVWESNLRLSAQLTEVLEEMRFLREHFNDDRRVLDIGMAESENVLRSIVDRSGGSK